MDIFCGKHGNKMSDLYCSYVSTTTTTNVTLTLVVVQCPLKPGEKSVKLNGKVGLHLCATLITTKFLLSLVNQMRHTHLSFVTDV